MKICRFNNSRLGILSEGQVVDVTGALDVLPTMRWPFPRSDLLVENLAEVLAAARSLLSSGERYAITAIRYLSPIANPPKIIAAPVNYRKHQDEANADGGKNFAAVVKSIQEYGLFLKSNTSLVGVSEGVEIAYPDRRTDHEIELAVVIGQTGRNIPAASALSYVAGYTLGLDMTLRGPQDRSLRKSLDSFTVLGPWLVTVDEITDPNRLDLEVKVNGRIRQRANTVDLIWNVQTLIEYASAHFTLLPGDVIFTGTPEGVGPVEAGDKMECFIERVGSVTVNVHAANMQY